MLAMANCVHRVSESLRLERTQRSSGRARPGAGRSQTWSPAPRHRSTMRRSLGCGRSTTFPASSWPMVQSHAMSFPALAPTFSTPSVVLTCVRTCPTLSAPSSRCTCQASARRLRQVSAARRVGPSCRWESPHHGPTFPLPHWVGGSRIPTATRFTISSTKPTQPTPTWTPARRSRVSSLRTRIGKSSRDVL